MALRIHRTTRKMSEQSEILGELLKIKKEEVLIVDDELIKQCYEVQRKHQFDPERNTLNQMRELIESSLGDEETS